MRIHSESIEQNEEECKELKFIECLLIGTFYFILINSSKSLMKWLLLSLWQNRGIMHVFLWLLGGAFNVKTIETWL